MRATGLTIHPAVADDVDEAALWYAAEARLGDAFLDEVEASLRRVLEGPRKYQILRERVRRAPLRRFPYGVFFSVDSDNGVTVYAVASLERDPFYWIDRVEEP